MEGMASRMAQIERYILSIATSYAPLGSSAKYLTLITSFDS